MLVATHAAGRDEELRYQIIRGLRGTDAASAGLLVRLTTHYSPDHRTFQFGRNVLASHETENVAAALDSLDTSAAAIAKASAVVKRRIEELDDTITELENRMQELEKENEKAMRGLQDKYLKDTTALQTRLSACEDKLRKVQQTLT